MAGGKVLKEGGELAVDVANELSKRIKKEISQRANQGDELAKQTINAWHGSPHDFPAERLVQFPDGRKEFIVGSPNTLPNVPKGATVLQDYPLGRMRMDKLGTGEGAQAYGHGLYAADAKDTAIGYRDDLSSSLYVDGKPLSIGNKPNTAQTTTGIEDVDDLLIAHKGDIDAAIADQKSWMDEYKQSKYYKDDTFQNETKILDELKRLKESGAVKRTSGGKLYNVNIDATPDELLDWDKPLSEQSEGVRNALSDIQEFTGSKRELGDVSGEGVYRSMRSSTGDDFERINKHLQDKGIKGIQYSDAISRGAEGGTKNYVIFDDSLIDIAKKYGIQGIATTGALGTLALSGLSPQQAQASEQAKQEYLQKRDYAIDPVNSKLLGFIADTIEAADRNIDGPLNMLIPVGVGEWARKGAYGEADLGDAFLAAFDLL